MSTLLEVRNLKKYFSTSRGMLHAVDDVSFQIEKGSTLGVVGESGCGKSTLGRVVLHLLDSTDGSILYNGNDITKVSRKELSGLHRKMQLIFQDPFSSLNPRMTVSQTIKEPLIISKQYTNAQADKKTAELMETVGLAAEYVNAYPHELDGGRRQRIGIARALALDPEFIVCDEPVSALDVSIQAQILNLLLDIQEQKGLTYIFVTHDMSVVKYISNNIIVMYLGQVVEMSETDELFKNPQHPYTQALLSAVPVPNVDYRIDRIPIQGEVTSPIDPKPGCRFASRCRFAKKECFMNNPTQREVGKNHFVSCHFVYADHNELQMNDTSVQADDQ